MGGTLLVDWVVGKVEGRTYRLIYISLQNDKSLHLNNDSKRSSVKHVLMNLN